MASPGSPAAALGVRASALTAAWYARPTRCIGMSVDGATVVTGTAPALGAPRVIIHASGADTRTLFQSAGDPEKGFRAALPLLGPALADLAPLECVPAAQRGFEWLLAYRGEPVLVSFSITGDQVAVAVKPPGRPTRPVGVLGLRDLSDIAGVWSHPIQSRFVVIGTEDGDEVVRWFDFGKAL